MSDMKKLLALFWLTYLRGAVLFHGYCCNCQHDHARRSTPRPVENVTLGLDERSPGDHRHDAQGHGDNPRRITHLEDNGHTQTVTASADAHKDTLSAASAFHGNRPQNESWEDGSLHSNTGDDHAHGRSDEEDIRNEQKHLTTSPPRRPPHHVNRHHHHHHGYHGEGHEHRGNYHHGSLDRDLLLHHHIRHRCRSGDQPVNCVSQGPKSNVTKEGNGGYHQSSHRHDDKVIDKPDIRKASQVALLEHRRYLRLLFTRYGSEDGGLSLKGLQRLLSSLSLGLQPQNPHEHNHTHGSNHTHGHHHDHHHHHHHHYQHHHHHGAHTLHKQCRTASELLSSYGMPLDRDLSADNFTFICTGLLYQVDSRACAGHAEETGIDLQTKETDSKRVLSSAAWTWGLLSITVLSILSLIGVVIVPLMNQVFFKYLLTLLVALAVGTLSGDALLHLLPHALGAHKHSHDHDHLAHKSESHVQSHHRDLWFGLTALMGVYVMFIIEHVVRLINYYRSHQLENVNKPTEQIVVKGAPNKVNVTGEEQNHPASEGVLGESDGDHGSTERGPAVVEEAVITVDGGLDDRAELSDDGSRDKEWTVSGPADAPVVTPDKGNCQRHHNEHHSHGHCHEEEEPVEGVKEVAWMVVFGDGVHSFSDGLIIGSAFTISITSGLSTFIAVFCHELPHELGDFAVLLKAGMAVRQALVCSLISALFGYLGVIIGTALGQHINTFTPWIFAITAGIFLYLALVVLLPEMLQHKVGGHHDGRLGSFLLQNLGLVVGFSLMLLIAVYE